MIFLTTLPSISRDFAIISEVTPFQDSPITPSLCFTAKVSKIKIIE